MKKRLLSLVLCLVMVFSLFPAFGMNALATIGEFDVDGIEESFEFTPLGTAWCTSSATDQLFVHVQRINKSTPTVGTLTLKNTSGSDAKISFHITSDFNRGSIVILNDGQEVRRWNETTPLRDDDFVVANGKELKFVLTSGTSGSGERYTEINLTKIKIEPSTPTGMTAENATVEVGSTATVDINATGCTVLNATSSNDSKVTVESFTDNSVTVRGVAVTSEPVTINVTGTNNTSTTFTVTVTEPEPQPLGDYAGMVGGKGLKDVQGKNADDEMFFSKQLIDHGNGNYEIEMKTFARGTTVHSSSVVPSDLILVLDLSASMSSHVEAGVDSVGKPMDKPSSVDVHLADLARDAAPDGATLYDYPEGNDCYYPVYCKEKTSYNNEFDRYDFYYVKPDGSKVYPDYPTDAAGKAQAQVHLSRIGVLKRALHQFLDKIEADGNDVRIGIVGFAGETASKSKIYGFKNNDLDTVQYNDNLGSSTTNLYDFAMKDCGTPAGLAALHYEVSSLRVETTNNTEPTIGFNMAKWILDDKSDSTLFPASPDSPSRNTTVVFFTDGQPEKGISNTTQAIQEANDSIDLARQLNQNPYNADVYSVGVFIFDDLTKEIGGDSTKTVNKFMEYTSSDYPKAVSFDDFKAKEGSGFYRKVDAENSLADIFQTIASHAATPSVNIGTEAQLRDTIDTSNFDVSNASIEVVTQQMNPDGTLVGGEIGHNDSTITDPDAANVYFTRSIETNETDHESVVKVSGFDYAKYYVGTRPEDDATIGQELIVRIKNLTIKENAEDQAAAAATGVSNAVASNVKAPGKSAGVYKDGEETTTTPIIEAKIPWTTFSKPEQKEPGTPVDTEPSEKNGDLYMKKGLYLDPNTGEYTVRMDAWSTGVVQELEVDNSVPTDIVLVVDLSDSMSIERDVIVGKNEDGTPRYGQRREALVNALDAFMEKLQQQANKHSDDNDYYRFALVTFGGSYRFQTKSGFHSKSTGGTYFWYPTNKDQTSTTNAFISSDNDNKPTSDYNTATLQSALRPVSAASVTAFNSTVHSTDEKTPFGYWRYNSTEPWMGLDYAKEILAARDASENDAQGNPRNSVVILFTDGAPGCASSTTTTTGGVANCDGYKTHADTAVQYAKNVKDIKGSKVFTIGLLSNPDYYNLWGTYNTQDSGIKIDTAMEAMSSDYPSATSLDNLGERTTDGNEYYTRVGTDSANVSKALENALGAVMKSVVSGHSDTSVGFNAYLKDVIDIENFEPADDFDVEAYAVPAIEVGETGITWGDTKIVEDQEVKKGDKTIIKLDADYNSTNKTVTVTGFDYSDTYTADNSMLGYKLVVRVKGLVPLHAGNDLTSNNGKAGIYQMVGQEEAAAIEVDSPTTTIEDEAIVIDYNYPVKLTDILSNKQYARVNSVKNRFAGEPAVGEEYISVGANSGTYKLAGSKLTYRLNDALMNPTLTPAENASTATGSVPINGEFTGADKALVYEKSDSVNVWKGYTTLPATSVYYADSLTAEQTTMKGVGNSDVAATSAVQFDGDTYGKKVTYTFTGTGIDVYSTTTEDAGYVIAQLTSTKEGFAPQNKMVLNRSTDDRYNTPSVWFTGLDYGTYTLTLYASKGAEFLLDGIRVYNPAGTNAEANEIYSRNDLEEQFATYTTLRDLLLEENSGMELVNGTGNVPEGGVGFYTDKGDEASVSGAWEVQKDDQGQPVKDENGKDVIVWNSTSYAAHSLGAYKVDGPKNEIYLVPGTGIAFTIQNWEEVKDYGLKYMVGLSVPESTPTEKKSATVTYSWGAQGEQNITDSKTINTAMDMYYEVKPSKDGTIMIINNSNSQSKIALTKLKVSGYSEEVWPHAAETTALPQNVVETEEPLTMDVVVNARTMAYAARFTELPTAEEVVDQGENPPAVTPEPTPDPEPDPEPTSPIWSVIQQIISSFVSSLFNSIARLFGH